MVKCEKCNGSGTIYLKSKRIVRRTFGFDPDEYETISTPVKCSACNSTGRVHSSQNEQSIRDYSFAINRIREIENKGVGGLNSSRVWNKWNGSYLWNTHDVKKELSSQKEKIKSVADYLDSVAKTPEVNKIIAEVKQSEETTNSIIIGVVLAILLSIMLLISFFGNIPFLKVAGYTALTLFIIFVAIMVYDD
jgi:hypothetical protein